MTRSIFEKSAPGRSEPVVPAPSKPLDAFLPKMLLRDAPPGLPDVAEMEVVRHFTQLSQKNFSIDTHFYPLGSCTMKYNPRINERIAAMPGWAAVNPQQPPESIPGLLELMRRLERYLAEISGMDAVTLQPAAGAHGELTAILLFRAYLKDHGKADRTEVLIPDSAHGTNPATCSMAGYKTVTVKTGENGDVDLADLEKKLGPKTAAMMITNPSTLGLFERGIGEIASRLHDAGALLYMDGANMNAILGIARPGDFGVDAMHFNLHKTFSTPHGGGGPGSGPVAVKSHLEPYLPVPRITESGTTIDRPKSIGQIKAFFGNVGMLVRAYTYIRVHGAEGLRRVSENAVLNANYIMARVKKAYPPYIDRPCMHEFVVSGARLAKKTGVHTVDVAKRLLDYGFHPPTIYFPLIVPECLMVEPTETENIETLDAFAAALVNIVREAKDDAEKVTTAPQTTPVKRINEVDANRNPVVRWRPQA